MLDPNMPLIQNNGKVCLLYGTVINHLPIVDENFGIFAQNAYRIVREAEMYQWKEVAHTKSSGSGRSRRTTTTYTHHKEWNN